VLTTEIKSVLCAFNCFGTQDCHHAGALLLQATELVIKYLAIILSRINMLDLSYGAVLLLPCEHHHTSVI
jgi:hypothetical protein